MHFAHSAGWGPGGGVYQIVNKATSTVVEVADGKPAPGLAIYGQAAANQQLQLFRQLWLIRQVKDKPYYTVENVRSDAFLDLVGGSAADNAAVEGLPAYGSAAQQWYIDGDDHDGYTFMNHASGTVLDLFGGKPENGTPIQGYRDHGGSNQKWFLHCHGRTPAEISTLLTASPLLGGQSFNHYVSDLIYVTLPVNVINTIWTSRNIGSRKWRPQSYDCDAFSFAMKSAIGDWVYENIRAPVAVAFGIVYGEQGSQKDAHAYNWYPSPDFSFINIFEPQDGTTQASPVHKAYFGVF